MSIADLDIAGSVQLFHHRWAVPVLAELHYGADARFVALTNRLSASRDAIRQALNSLIEAGIVMREPSHAHSSRPEYILTPAGGPLALVAANLMQEIRAQKIGPIALRKWGMTIIFVLGLGHTRFNELKSVLPGVSPRALALALKDLQSHGLVERLVTETYPPATAYSLTEKSLPLFPPLHDFFAAATHYLRAHREAVSRPRAPSRR